MIKMMDDGCIDITELAIGNIVRRVLFIIRREVATSVNEQKSGKAGDKTYQSATVILPFHLISHSHLHQKTLILSPSASHIISSSSACQPSTMLMNDQMNI
jgi:hypothetical protein